MAPEERTKPSPPASAIKRWLPLGVFVGFAGFAYWQGWFDYLTLEQVAKNRGELRTLVADHYLWAVLGFGAIYVAVTALSLPAASLITITGGFLFGWFVAGLIAVAAATAGATIVFLIAKTSFGDALRAKAGPKLTKLAKGFSDDALSYLLFLRLVPAFPFWLVNLAPAFLGVRLSTFVIGTFVGIIPGTFAFAFLGAGFDKIIAEQEMAYQACLKSGDQAVRATCSFSINPGALLNTELIMAFVALGVIALIPVALKRWRSRSAA